MSQLLALLIVVTILYIGDAISVRTKAWIPSVFICAILFLIGYWTFFPKEIVALAGFNMPIIVVLMYLLVTNMGTLLSVNELINQWKTIVISLSGIVGVIVSAYFIGSALFDSNTAVIAIPPLVGGVVSSAIMSQEALKLGLTELSVFAVIIYVMQGFVGYPLTSIMLKREANKVLQQYRAGTWHVVEHDESYIKPSDDNNNALPKLFKRLIPMPYNTVFFKFLRLIMVAALAYYCSEWAKPYVEISPFVLCLLFGVIAASLGFLEPHPLRKANAFGFALLGLMLFIFDSLKRATPEMLLNLLTPLVVLIGVATIGMYIFSYIAGKLLGVSKEMAFAISLTSMYGFPADYIITQEVITLVTRDEKEREVLTHHMLGPMLVGGFISVTIVSVILAGIFVSFLSV